MKQPLIAFLFFFNVFLIGCNQSKNIKRYKYIGEVSFRRTYAGSAYWPEAMFDSVDKSNPRFMFTLDTVENKTLDKLIALGIANKDGLFLEKISPYLKDTVFIASKMLRTDTAFIKYETSNAKASIQIKNGNTSDSIPIEDESWGHGFSLVSIKDRPSPYIVFLNQYYIMNGYNYEVSLFEKK